MYFFSVVIPIHNKNDFLARSVQSVLRQTFSDFELICVDDGSDDEELIYLNYLENLHISNVKIIRQVNQGVSSARNFGAQISKGKYLAFLDADDEWSVEYLTEMFNLINTYKFASAYVSGYECESEHKKWSVIYRPSNKSGLIKNYFKRRVFGWGVHTSSVIIRKDVFFSRGWLSQSNFFKNSQFNMVS